MVISLSLTLAIVDGLSVGVGGEVYIVPLVSIIASLQFKRGEGRRLTGVGEVFQFRGDYIPIIRLHDAFNLEPRYRDLELGSVMVVECDGRKVGLFVDELLGQRGCGQVHGDELPPHRGGFRRNHPRGRQCRSDSRHSRAGPVRGRTLRRMKRFRIPQEEGPL